MDKIMENVVKVMAAIGGAVAGFFGTWTVLLTCLAIAMSLDYLTGFLVACRGYSPKTADGKLSSKAGLDGLFRKGGIVIVVILGTILDKLAGNQTAIFQSATVAWFIINEGLSIIENVGLMGVQIPPFIKKLLDTLKSKSDDGPPEGGKIA